MPDDFNKIASRLLNRCPAAGILLARDFVQDGWRQLQARREWSWRRGSGCFAPPNLYQTGRAHTNVSFGAPNRISGVGTNWTPDMVGRQIRLGGLNYPYYTIQQYISPVALLIDQPWCGPDAGAGGSLFDDTSGTFDDTPGLFDDGGGGGLGVTYQIVQCFYPVPADFNYFYVAVSIKDSYRLWTTVTQSELAMLDPQRTNQGQTYAIAFRDYTQNFGGTIGPCIQVSGSGPAPVSTTTYGYNYIANATYIIQVTTGGTTGTARFQWLRAGQVSFQGPLDTDSAAMDLQDGVQLYWPDDAIYVAGDIFVINALSQIQTGVPRYELWPAPTLDRYLYPYIYVKKEYDLTPQQPQLPPFIANRGDVLLEMGLASCARYPGPDADHPNPYFDLKLAQMHDMRAEHLLLELERNDEEIGVTEVMYESYPLFPAPWATGSWQQQHAPFLMGA